VNNSDVSLGYQFVNSKRKTKSGVSELHTERDGIKIIASDDGEKAEILADFFSSVLDQVIL
jgi:hypothetical protein